MAGKHVAPRESVPEPRERPGPRRGRRAAIVAVVALVLVGAATATAFALRSDDGSKSAAVAADASACTGVVSLPVLATPAVSTVITNIANEWEKSVPLVGSKCINVAVEGTESDVATQQLASSPSASV